MLQTVLSLALLVAPLQDAPPDVASLAAAGERTLAAMDERPIRWRAIVRPGDHTGSSRTSS